MRATARREHREHREREVGRRGRRCEPGRGVQGCFTRTRPGVKGATPRARPDRRALLADARDRVSSWVHVGAPSPRAGASAPVGERRWYGRSLGPRKRSIAVAPRPPRSQSTRAGRGCIDRRSEEPRRRCEQRSDFVRRSSARRLDSLLAAHREWSKTRPLMAGRFTDCSQHATNLFEPSVTASIEILLLSRCRAAIPRLALDAVRRCTRRRLQANLRSRSWGGRIGGAASAARRVRRARAEWCAALSVRPRSTEATRRRIAHRSRLRATWHFGEQVVVLISWSAISRRASSYAQSATSISTACCVTKRASRLRRWGGIRQPEGPSRRIPSEWAGVATSAVDCTCRRSSRWPSSRAPPRGRSRPSDWGRWRARGPSARGTSRVMARAPSRPCCATGCPPISTSATSRSHRSISASRASIATRASSWAISTPPRSVCS
jgi:hypothetical protein